MPPVERFLEKAGSGSGRGSRNSSLGSSPQRSPRSRDGDDYGHGFRINLRQEKRSKFSSLVSKLMGNDQVCIGLDCCYLFSSHVVIT